MFAQKLYIIPENIVEIELTKPVLKQKERIMRKEKEIIKNSKGVIAKKEVKNITTMPKHKKSEKLDQRNYRDKEIKIYKDQNLKKDSKADKYSIIKEKKR